MTEQTKLVFNGIDGGSGDYLFAPGNVSELASSSRSRIIGTAPITLESPSQLKRARFAGPPGVDPREPRAAGWGVVIPKGLNSKIKKAVTKLINHRQKRFGYLMVKELSYEAPQDSEQWKNLHAIDAGFFNPNSVPYYLLLVGDTEQIPFHFEQGLSSAHAVGRINFDSIEDFEGYINSVIEHEEETTPAAESEVAFFGTRHDGDEATENSFNYLITPLSRENYTNLKNINLLEASATKDALMELLQRSSPPAVMFSATHGVWMNDRPDVAGSILCQDWKGLWYSAEQQ